MILIFITGVLPNQNFKLHIGKETLFQVVNPYSVTLPQLSAIY